MGGQVALFLGALLLTLAASEIMVRGLTGLGARLKLSEGLLGLLTALAADAPELSSAVFAILAGSGAVGIGVVLGSNLFNLAALLGLSALVTGELRMHRASVVLDGVAGLVALGLTGLLMVRGVPAAAVTAPLLALFALYAVLLSLRPGALRRLRLPGPMVRAVVFAPGHLGHEAEGPPGGSRWAIWLLLPAVAGVVAGSFGLVHSALALAADLHVSPGVTGGLVLAVLTSLPNAYAAVHLGRHHRGTAVMSAAMNSNTINLLGGLAIPAALFGFVVGGAAVAYGWLCGMTLLAVGLSAARQRLGRPAAAVVIAAYLGFVAYSLRP